MLLRYNTHMERYSFDGWNKVQPDIGIEFNFETTYTSDTNRVISGILMDEALFTVESLSFEFSHLTLQQISELQHIIIPRKGKEHYQLHYLSDYYGGWRTDTFYTGKGSGKLRKIMNDDGTYNLKFNAIGVNPIC